jgi:hypothetical protein
MTPDAVDALDDVVYDGMIRHMEREAAEIQAEHARANR